jgi:hypothetical protein
MKSRSDEIVSDWGIDMDTTISPTLVNIDLRTSSMSSFRGADNGSFGQFDDDSTVTEPMVPQDYENLRLVPNAYNVSITQILRKVLSQFHELDGQFENFQDEFKYILITSQLLDETLLISKYKKKISSLHLKVRDSLIVTRFGIRFKQMQSQYSMNGNYLNSISYLRIICFLRYLSINHDKFNRGQLKSILIIITVNIYGLANIRSFSLKVIETVILNGLRRFIKNYQKLDISIIKLMNNFKELSIFPNLTNNTVPTQSTDLQKSEEIYDVLNSTLILSVNGIINNIVNIFHCINSSGLKNYCEIYNIQLEELNYHLSSKSCNSSTSDYDKMSQNLKKFLYLRRFFICCLLSTNEVDSDPTYLHKISRIFHIPEPQSSHISDNFERFSAISKALQNLYKFSETVSNNLNGFMAKENSRVLGGKDTSTIMPTSQTPSHLIKLTHKLKEIQLNLATLDDNNSIDDQIQEFAKIGELLTSVHNIYNQDLTNLQKSSQTNKPFHLAQRSYSSPLDNRSSSILLSKRKRFSLPPQQQFTLQARSSPTSGSMSPASPSTSTPSSTPKSYKRLSTGLSIPLLTVMENENDIFDASSVKKVSYDDNYINITPSLQSPSYPPPTNVTNADYISEHQLLSNDDSIVITPIVNEAADYSLDNNVLDNDDFKRKLERNFNRVLSTSTVLGTDESGDGSSYRNKEEIYYNDSKVDAVEGGLLIDELKSKMNHRLNV